MIVNWNRKRGLKKVGLVGLKVCGSFWLTVQIGTGRGGPSSKGRIIWPGLSSSQPQSMAFWRVKQGMDTSERGPSRDWKKVAVHSIGG